MPKITTTTGTEYTADGPLAWPTSDPRGQHRWNNPGNYNAALDWGMDVAAALGLLVDAGLSRNDYRVRSAGAEWREVYERLRAGVTV